MNTININDFKNSYTQLLAEADRYLQFVISLEKKYNIDLQLFSKKPEISCSAYAFVIEDNILKFQIYYTEYEGYYLSEDYTYMPDNIDLAIENITNKCLKMVKEREEKRKKLIEQQLQDKQEKEKKLLKELQIKYPDI